MSKSFSVSYAQIVVILIGFPIVYMINSFMPWSKQIMSGNRDYFMIFWLSIFIIHWGSAFLSYYFGKKEGYSLKDFGYTLSKKQTIIGLLVYFSIAAFLLILVHNANPDVTTSKMNSIIYNFYPISFMDRVFWVFIALTAGICEEFVYRGFGITALQSKKFPKWLVVLLTSISFVFIHGIAAFKMFPFYLFFGILFALIRLWRKSIVLNVIIHALIDLSVLMIVLA